MPSPLIAVLQGPNLDQLGQREPEYYGQVTLDQLHTCLTEQAERLGLRLCHQQHTAEADLVLAIHALDRQGVDGIIINPAAYTHTSVAIRDALRCRPHRPFIEVHLSNPLSREPFRHRSLLAEHALGIICGFGVLSYVLALEAMAQKVSDYEH